MKYCSHCIMPDTRPGTKLVDGICQACTNFDNRKNVNWKDRFWQLTHLTHLAKKYRDIPGMYNCVIPVSGGKDSHYLVDLYKNTLGMTPLLVCVHDGFSMTEAGKYNLRNLSEHFGCDLIEYTPNIQWLKQITRKEFETIGNFPHVDGLIYTVPVAIAQKFNIKLVVYGEDPEREYGTSDKNSDIWTMIDFITDTTMKPVYDQDMQVIFTSHYVPWSSYGNYINALKHGFRDLRTEWRRADCIEDWDSIDSVGWQLSNFLKYQKFGYGRATDIACRLIREGRLTRSEAVELVNLHDGKLDAKIMHDFTNFTGYPLNEFLNIAGKWWNKDIFMQGEGGWMKKPEYILR